MTYGEVDLIGTLTRLIDEAGWTDPLTPDQLARLDQFHAGGMAAVDRLIDALGVGPGQRVLDVGSGLGGPARRVATQTGATVLGVDITPGFVDAASALTARCELDGLVSFECADAAQLAETADYDAAMTLHVQMNVADKVSFFGGIRSALRPGGRLAMWDICSVGDGELDWPMPWSIDGSDSYLVSVDSLRDATAEAGFEVVEWSDETQWVSDWFASTFSDGPPPGPALPMWMDDGFTRILNLAGALGDGKVAVVRGVLTA